MSRFEVRLERESVFTRRPCLTCEGSNDKDAANAVVIEDGEHTPEVVCATCLRLGRAAIVVSLGQKAARLRRWAANLEALSDTLHSNPEALPLPTYEQWEQANRDANAEAEAEYLAAQATKFVTTDDDIPAPF